MEKHSAGTMVVFQEQLRVTRMSKKEAKEYAKNKGIESKGRQMLLELGLLALVEAYDDLRAKYQETKSK